MIAALLFTTCAKTDEDLQRETKLQEQTFWGLHDDNGTLDTYYPVYIFDEDNEGYTTIANSMDPMTWEVRNNELRIYYDNGDAPDYRQRIGYDKYYSRTVFRINEFSDTQLEVTLYLFGGYQSNLTMMPVDTAEIDWN